jgi:hypothetical protein
LAHRDLCHFAEGPMLLPELLFPVTAIRQPGQGHKSISAVYT